MKVLFITHRYPPHTGGVETHVQEIATRLIDRGHSVTVFSADAGSNVSSESTDDGVQVRRFRSLSPSGAFYVAPQIASAVRRADADVVHAHNYHSLTTFFATFGITGERFVVTPHYHGASADGARDCLLSLYHPYGKWTLRKADTVIAVSKWEQRQLRSDFGVEAIVVPNGLNHSRFRDVKPEMRECPYLLCVGRLEEYKGVQYAIRALQSLPERELVIAGSGPFRSNLEQIVKEIGCEDRVTFLGFVDETRLPKLYAGADVHLQFSTFEAYGMTVAESLAAKTPVVVKKNSALIDWLDVDGVVGVTEMRPQSIKTAVRSAMKGACLNPNSISDWDQVTDRLVQTYNSVGTQSL